MLTGFLNCSLTCFMTGSISSSFFVISSVLTSGIPSIVAIWRHKMHFTNTTKLHTKAVQNKLDGQSRHWNPHQPTLALQLYLWYLKNWKSSPNQDVAVSSCVSNLATHTGSFSHILVIVCNDRTSKPAVKSLLHSRTLSNKMQKNNMYDRNQN